MSTRVAPLARLLAMFKLHFVELRAHAQISAYARGARFFSRDARARAHPSESLEAATAVCATLHLVRCCSKDEARARAPASARSRPWNTSVKKYIVARRSKFEGAARTRGRIFERGRRRRQRLQWRARRAYETTACRLLMIARSHPSPSFSFVVSTGEQTSGTNDDDKQTKSVNAEYLNSTTSVAFKAT